MMPNELGYPEDPAGAVDPMLDPAARGLAEADPAGQQARNEQLNKYLARWGAMLGGSTLLGSLAHIFANMQQPQQPQPVRPQPNQMPLRVDPDAGPESSMDAVVHPTPG
jgi:hypothetical protein